MKWVFFAHRKDTFSKFRNQKLLFFVTNSLVALVFLFVISLATLSTIAPQVISQHLKNAFYPSKNPVQSVLQAATQNLALTGEISFNLPAIFNENVFIDSTASVSGDLTAPNIIYGIIAGENITVSPGQTPTISAELDVIAGSGISITDGTIANTDGGSSQNIFKNITVGSTTLSAGSNDDTLQFAAGSNVSLSTNTSTKTITISSSTFTPSGLTTNGVLYADSSSSFVSLTPGTSGFVLQSNGAGSPPSWVVNSATTPSFSVITSGTNTTAAMVVGTGASLDFSGSGTINASTLGGATFAAPGPIGSTTPGSGAFTTLTSSSTLISTGLITANGGLTVANGQNTTLSSFTTNNNSVLYTDASGIITAATTTSNGLCLLSNGANAAPSWTTCPGGGGSTNWDVINGAITPKLTSTLDFLLGSPATPSAKFAVTGITGGATPFASVSATIASGGSGNGVTLGGNSSIQSLQNSTLTIGGNSTGNIVLSPLNGGAGSQLTINAVTTTFNGTTTLNAASLSTIDSAASLGIDATTLTLGNGSAATLATTINGLTLDSGSNTLTIAASDTVLTASGLGTFTTAATLGVSATTLNLGAGSDATIGTVSDDNLTLAPNGTGNIILSGDFDSQVIIGATGASTEFPLLVRSGIGSNATVAIDQLNSGDIFTASASGTTRLTLSNGGNLNLIGGVYQSGGVSGLTQATAVCVTTTGGIVTGTGACPSVAANLIWQTGSGTIFQGNTTQDLLIGGVATTSAKFAVTGINGTENPVATIAATPSSGITTGLSLSGTGAIQALNMNTLTLGGTTTGNIVIDSGSSAITLADNTTLSQNLTIGGTTGITFSTTGGINLAGGTIVDSTDGVDIADALEVSGLITANGGLTVPSGQTTTLASFTNDGGVIYANSSGVLAQTAAGTALQCLIGGTTPSFTNCTSVGSNWNVINGTIQPKFASVLDLLIGGVSSDSARFHAYGSLNAGTTPAASIAAQSSFAAFVIDNKGSGDLVTASASGATRFTIKNNGDVQINGSSSAVFSIKDQFQNEFLSLDNLDSIFSIFSNNTGHLKSITTNSTSITAREGHTSVVVNGFAYVLGGCNGGNQSTVQFAQINADGSLGNWGTTTSLPVASCNNAGTTYNGYIYVNGGTGTGSTSTRIYYAKPNSDGTISSWTTAGTTLASVETSGMRGHAMVAYNGYLYFIGGEDESSGANRNIYYLRINSDGSLGPSITTLSNWFSADCTSGNGTSNTANGFLYVVCGSTIRYGKMLENGGIGSAVISGTSLSSARSYGMTTVLNGYLYSFGGDTGAGPTTIISYAPLNNNGSVGAWTNDSTSLPGARNTAGIFTYNGYVYLLGGSDTPSSTPQNNVWYTSGPRTRLAGALDLVNFTGESTASSSGSGGHLTAGDTRIIGLLTVNGNAWFGDGLGVRNNLTVQGQTALMGKDGTSAVASISGNTSFAGLVVDNSGSGDLFTASSSGLRRVVIRQNGDLELGGNQYISLDSGSRSHFMRYISSVNAISIQTTGIFQSVSSTFNAKDVAGTSYLTGDGSNHKWGINTGNSNSSILASLDVRSSPDAGGIIAVASASGNTSFAALVADNRGSGDLFTASSSGLTRFTIRQNGNVGVGTNMPLGKLTLGNNIATDFLDNYDEYQIMLFDGGTAPESYGLGIKGSTVVFNSGIGAYSFDRAGTATSVSIDTAGQLILHPMGVSEGGQVTFMEGTSEPTDDTWLMDSGVTAGNDPDFRVIEESTVRVYLDDDVGTGWIIPSDRRLKTNIQTLENVLDKLKLTRGVSFDLNSGPQNQLGVIAQELQAAFPALVSGDETTGYLGVSYDVLSAVLLQGVKELDEKTDSINNTLTVAGDDFNNRLVGLESNVTASSTDFSSSVISLRSDVLSLTDRVASLEGQLQLFTANNQPLNQFNASTSAELSLDSLSINGMTITDRLTVISYATMNELSVTGDITAGLLSIKGLHNGGSSISTLNGDLQLQDRGFGGIDILNGLVTIDTSGNLVSQATITAKKFNIDTTDTLSASLGEATLDAGETRIEIETTAVTDSSAIFITPKTKTNLPLSVTQQTPGASFRVEVAEAAPEDITFNWWIVN